MEDKSHVGLGHQVCPICGDKHDEVVLLDKRLRNTLTRDMTIGVSLCPKHESMSKEYVALVGVSNTGTSRKLNPEDAIRTGEVAHLRWEVADRMFSVPMDRKQPVVFVDSAVIAHLTDLKEGASA